MSWQKSSFSNPSGNSVECTITDEGAQLRDSKLGDDSPILYYTRKQWDNGRGAAFTRFARTLVPENILHARQHDEGSKLNADWYRVEHDSKSLYFDEAEIKAWEQGVEHGEFTMQD